MKSQNDHRFRFWSIFGFKFAIEILQISLAGDLAGKINVIMSPQVVILQKFVGRSSICGSCRLRNIEFGGQGLKQSLKS